MTDIAKIDARLSNDPLTAVIAERDHTRAQLRQANEELDQARHEVDRLIREKNEVALERDAVQREVEALKGDLRDAEESVKRFAEERDVAQSNLDFLRAEIDKATGSTATFDRVHKLHELRGECDTWKARAARLGVDLAKGPDRTVVVRRHGGGPRRTLTEQHAENMLNDETADPSLGDVISDEAYDAAATRLDAADGMGVPQSVLDQLVDGIGPTLIGSPATREANFREAFEEGHKPETVLEEAARIVDGPRRAHYGHPAENHGRTALYWNAYLGIDPESPDAVDGHDVCQMNNLQKISRESGKQRKPRRQRDTLVDQCGYARNAEIVDLTEED